MGGGCIVMQAAIEKALSLVGQGYIYGAKGQTCSLAFRQQQAEQYPEQADNILGTGAKWDGVPVWDCAQLTRAVAKEAGVTLVSGATSQWNKTDWAETGPIETIPQGKTCFVYRRKNGSTTVMQHTGVALGDGTCVHARGTAYGVVRQTMAQHAWTHWALPKWPENAGNDMEEDVPMSEAKIHNIPQNETVNMRSMPSKSSGVVARIPYGTAVQAGEPDNGWCLVMHGGKTGYIMQQYLQFAEGAANEAASPDGDELVTISIPRSAAQALYEAFQKAGWA